MTGVGGMTMHTTRVRVFALAAALMTNACSSSTPEAEEPAQAAPAPVANEQLEPAEGEEIATPEESPPADDAALVEILLEADGDLDGEPGDEHLVLRGDGSLEAGAWRGVAEIPEMSEYWAKEQAVLGVVVLDRRGRTNAVLVTLPIAEDEDPPNRYQLFVQDGADGLRRVLDVTIGAYGVHALVFPGDGTARYDEDGWGACDRLNHPTRAQRQRIVYAMDGETMVERSRRNTGRAQRCDELSACPYVYVLGDGEPELVGEILRNLRGRASYAAQTLALPGPDHGGLRLRLAEEKSEVTHLDEVYLAIDGIRIPPRSCTVASPRPSYCLADGEHHVMREGDVLDLVFDASASDAVLHATGYYVPTGP